MKCPRYEVTQANSMERGSAVENKVFHVKVSPVKQQLSPIKPQSPPAAVTTALFSLNDSTGTVHNKENSTGTQDEAFEDSGYLSLRNSRIEDPHHHGDKEESPTVVLLPSSAQQEKRTTPKNSPRKCPARTNSSRVLLPSTPGECPRRRKVTYSLSSTPSSHHDNPNLPILRFQQAVCEELAKSYQKNKSFDWSIVSKVAEDHLLDRVIGGHMGLEYIDMFSSLLSRNMKSILTYILALLGDMDLISCKKVSKTWKRIICDDKAALKRCLKAEQELGESASSLRQQGFGLTRDVAVSRVVLSCMQTLASSTPIPSSSSSSSTLSSRVNKRTSAPQKDSQGSRFKDFLQVASGLKQHESLRQCPHCTSPAKHLPEAMRATCTRASCQFDFCTSCKGAFHGSSPCRVLQPRAHFSSRSPQIIPGGARSKRNVKRL